MFTVSTCELDRLGRELRAACAVIIRHSKGDLGIQLANDGPLTKAILSVEHDWSRQRDSITKYLDQVGQGAHDAARLYDAIEREIERAAIPAGIKVTR